MAVPEPTVSGSTCDCIVDYQYGRFEAHTLQFGIHFRVAMFGAIMVDKRIADLRWSRDAGNYKAIAHFDGPTVMACFAKFFKAKNGVPAERLAAYKVFESSVPGSAHRFTVRFYRRRGKQLPEGYRPAP